MSANQGWRRSFSSTPTVFDRRSASRRAAALGRYPSSAMARMTASRLAALTLGESCRTSETSDFDTPAWAATVSSVGLGLGRPIRPVPADVTSPSVLRRAVPGSGDGLLLLERSNSRSPGAPRQRAPP